MSNDNLPPGVSVNDLPGQTPGEIEWEKFLDEITTSSLINGLTVDECRQAWKAGVFAVTMAKQDVEKRLRSILGAGLLRKNLKQARKLHNDPIDLGDENGK